MTEVKKKIKVITDLLNRTSTLINEYDQAQKTLNESLRDCLNGYNKRQEEMHIFIQNTLEKILSLQDEVKEVLSHKMEELIKELQKASTIKVEEEGIA